MQILWWTIDAKTLFIAAVVWTIAANLFVFLRRKNRLRDLRALGEKLGLTYHENADDLVSRMPFSRFESLEGMPNAPLDVASAVTFATQRRHFTHAITGRLHDRELLVFDCETPQFRNAHPRRSTVIAWNIAPVRWPKFRLNPRISLRGVEAAMQVLRDRADIDPRVTEEITAFAHDRYPLNVEAADEWVLFHYPAEALGADELARFIDESADCLQRCFEPDLSPLS